VLPSSYNRLVDVWKGLVGTGDATFCELLCEIGMAVGRRMLQARVTQKVKDAFRLFMVDLKACLSKCVLGLARWTTFKVLPYLMYMYLFIYSFIYLCIFLRILYVLVSFYVSFRIFCIQFQS
jgi:hypothetical protein